MSVLVISEGCESDCQAIEAIERGLADIQTPEEIRSYYAPGLATVLYEGLLPGTFRGVDAIVEGYARQMTDIASIKIDFHELVIQAVGSLGAAFSIQHAVVRTKSGGIREARFRQTDVLRKLDRKWMIIHQHVSYPIDSSTGLGVIS